VIILKEIIFTARRVNCYPLSFVIKFAKRDPKTNVIRKEETWPRKKLALRPMFFRFSIGMLCIMGFNGYYKKLDPTW